MSKKKKNNPVQSYILAIKSMSLASGMMVFGAACDSIKKEISRARLSGCTSHRGVG